ncbi:MAG: transcriptional regulator, partial [Planctomycetes bacterium]|nr:transcriptional regulator [Planctomycetota bacterium]
EKSKSLKELMEEMGLKHRPTFSANYLNPAIQNHWVEMTIPGNPHSPEQKYRITITGKKVSKDSS